MTQSHFGKRKNVFDVLKERGFIAQCTHQTTLRKLLAKGQITAYVGYDATAKSLTAGHLVPILAHAHLQQRSHENIILIGGGTTLIGDPSDRTEMRQMLSKKQIKSNLIHFRKQFERIFQNIQLANPVHSKSATLFLDNSEWLTKLNHLEFLREIGPHFSVNRMLASSAYEKRLEQGLTFLEFSYMPLQAYDYLYLYRKYNCVLQMGGDDQWSNILAGVDLIRRVEGSNVFGLTYPLLTTGSGAKMGKTAAGAIWLDPKLTTPYDFYQYWINTDDKDVEHFLTMFTFLPIEEVRRLGSLKGAQIRQAKEILAYEVTKIVHGGKKAEDARRTSRALFGKESKAVGAPRTLISKAKLQQGLPLADLFVHTGLTNSKSTARRLIKQKGAYLNEKVIEDGKKLLSSEDFENGIARLRAGKKQIHLLKLEN